ncbi:MAG: hypothetical protein PHY54_03570 [Methylococcales bacterium]|nr:hypothetical protein [Methylococcales bacterium]
MATLTRMETMAMEVIQRIKLMASATPVKRSMETMVIEVISNISLIVNMRNTANMDIIVEAGVMASTGGMIMID